MLMVEKYIEPEEITINMVSVNVAVEERRLRVNWEPMPFPTKEPEDLYKRELITEIHDPYIPYGDIHAFHNIDAEAELTALLSEELAKEIDRQIVQDIFEEMCLFEKELIIEKVNE